MEDFKIKVVDYLFSNYSKIDWERPSNGFDVVTYIKGYKIRLSNDNEGYYLHVDTTPIIGSGYSISGSENGKVIALYKIVWEHVNNKAENLFWFEFYTELKNQTEK